MKRLYRVLMTLVVAGCLTGLLFAVLTIFFDQSVIVRKGTIYRQPTEEKLVALTFDDGPSPDWTPQILDQLKKYNVKATFFLLGKHADRYPEVARRVVQEGHEIGNHTYSHPLLLYYTKDELRQEIIKAQDAIQRATGITTKYFRPPKAWLTKREKKKINEMGYKIILWTLNSKDWVTFHARHMVTYIKRNIKPGDILLFHDAGGAFTTEGGSRKQTVKALPGLIEALTEQGYRFVTISKLLNGEKQ